jgi:hypothetical protein
MGNCSSLIEKKEKCRICGNTWFSETHHHCCYNNCNCCGTFEKTHKHCKLCTQSWNSSTHYHCQVCHIILPNNMGHCHNENCRNQYYDTFFELHCETCHTCHNFDSFHCEYCCSNNIEHNCTRIIQNPNQNPIINVFPDINISELIDVPKTNHHHNHNLNFDFTNIIENKNGLCVVCDIYDEDESINIQNYKKCCVMPNCKQLICIKCLKDWIKKNGEEENQLFTCPMCRKFITINELINTKNLVVKEAEEVKVIFV